MARKSFFLIPSVQFVATGLLLLYMSLSGLTLDASAAKSNTFILTRMNDSQPIITKDMFDALGATYQEGYNINGPSVIRVPDWIPPGERADPNAVYYLYFAHHAGNYIRLAWATEIEGPWHLYQIGSDVSVGERGVLDLGSNDKINLDYDMTISNHVASPDVFVDDQNQRIIMYFHAGSVNVGGSGMGQKSLVATSSYGLDFQNGIEPVILGRFYFRVFEYNGNLYATSNSGYLFKARDPNHPWKPPPGFDLRDDLWIKRPDSPYINDLDDADFSLVADDPLRVRHFTVRRIDDTLQMLYSRIGDCPERIMISTIDLSVGDYELWDASFPPNDVLRAEPDWEGGEIPPRNSQGSAAPENVNQLRDPYLFQDSDYTWYIFYCARGEDAIGVVRVSNIAAGDFYLDGYVDNIDLVELKNQWLKESNGLRADLNHDGEVNITDFAIFAKDWTGADTAYPQPDPLTWALAPTTFGGTICMTAGYACDPNGVAVQYYFNNVTNPNHDSGWQSGRCYQDDHLLPNTLYTYRVKVHDKSARRNETDWSSSLSTTTGDIYEAEDAVVIGAAIANNHPGYTGAGFVDYLNSSGDYVEWTVSADTADTYTLVFRYALGSVNPRSLEIKVNGIVVKASLSFANTGSWRQWQIVSITAALNAGNNTVRATAIGSSGPNLDRLGVSDI